MARRDGDMFVVGHRMRIADTPGPWGFATVTLGDGVPGPPPHHHERAHEFYHVLEGAVEVLKGERWHRLETGESITIPAGTVHTFRGVGSGTNRLVTIHDPGEAMDALFLKHGVPAGQDGSFERSVSEETIGRFIADAPRHDMILAGDAASA